MNKDTGITICGQNYSDILFLSEDDEVLGILTDDGKLVLKDGYKIECTPVVR